jgi:hypothetical protein
VNCGHSTDIRGVDDVSKSRFRIRLAAGQSLLHHLLMGFKGYHNIHTNGRNRAQQCKVRDSS